MENSYLLQTHQEIASNIQNRLDGEKERRIWIKNAENEPYALWIFRLGLNCYGNLPVSNGI